MEIDEDRVQAIVALRGDQDQLTQKIRELLQEIKELKSQISDQQNGLSTELLFQIDVNPEEGEEQMEQNGDSVSYKSSISQVLGQDSEEKAKDGEVKLKFFLVDIELA